MPKLPKKSSKHPIIPALPPQELENAIEHLQGLDIDSASKRQLENMLRAAANPDADKPDVVVQSFSEERQENFKEGVKKLVEFQQGIMKRGREGLMAMSDAEWDALVDEANEGEE